MFLEGKDYLSNHLILDEKTGEQKIRDFQFHFVELPKFNKTEKQLKTLTDKWIYFIKNADHLANIPGVLKKEPEIEQAFEILEETNWSSKELEIYDYLWDRKQVAIGQQRFQYKKGLREGLKEGELKAKKETARNLIKIGLSTQDIVAATGLSVKDINALKKCL